MIRQKGRKKMKRRGERKDWFLPVYYIFFSASQLAISWQHVAAIIKVNEDRRKHEGIESRSDRKEEKKLKKDRGK